MTTIYKAVPKETEINIQYLHENIRFVGEDVESIDINETKYGQCVIIENAPLLNTINLRKPGAVVCNIGHFDTEIDTQFMRDNWRWVEIKPQVHQVFRSDDENDYLILLAEGRLVNLGNATGHPSRVMDGSFANQVLAQMYLFEEKFADLPMDARADNLYVKVLPKKLDEEVAAAMVAGFNGTLTKLTEKQAEYLGVPVEGPFKPEEYKY